MVGTHCHSRALESWVPGGHPEKELGPFSPASLRTTTVNSETGWGWVCVCAHEDFKASLGFVCS